jgi:hypothetical protein
MAADFPAPAANFPAPQQSLPADQPTAPAAQQRSLPWWGFGLANLLVVVALSLGSW